MSEMVIKEIEMKQEEMYRKEHDEEQERERERERERGRERGREVCTQREAEREREREREKRKGRCKQWYGSNKQRVDELCRINQNDTDRPSTAFSVHITKYS